MHQIRQTHNVSVFKVGFVGGLKYEGPICKGRRIVSWHTAWPRYCVVIYEASYILYGDSVQLRLHTS